MKVIFDWMLIILSTYVLIDSKNEAINKDNLIKAIKNTFKKEK